MEKALCERLLEREKGNCKRKGWCPEKMLIRDSLRACTLLYIYDAKPHSFIVIQCCVSSLSIQVCVIRHVPERTITVTFISSNGH